MSNDVPEVSRIIRSRRSVRGFLPTPLPDDVLREILRDAQEAPSNCNTQPWNVHIVSGETRNVMSAALVAALREERYTLDFTFDKNAYPAPYSLRAADQGRTYYQALGVAREDVLGRADVVERNVRFFGAPHAAFLFMPAVGDSVRVASDVGMYAQTFLLSLAARGYAGIPQAVLSYFADTVRGVLGLPETLKLLFGISFGTSDTTGPAYSYTQGRAALDENVTFHRSAGEEVEWPCT